MLVATVYLIYNFYKEISYKNNHKFNLESYSKQYNNDGNKVIKETKINYYMILEIPEINLKQGIFNINDKRNQIDKNVTILNIDIFNNKINSLVLVSHSGNASNAYFKNLHKLKLNNEVIIYYNDRKYIYKVNKIYSNTKNSTFSINKNHKDKLILITCLNRKEYLILECI